MYLIHVAEHLQREKVVGGGADVGVEDDQWHARVLLLGTRIIVIVRHAPRQNDGAEQGEDK